jgi:hypothetical protein
VRERAKRRRIYEWNDLREAFFNDDKTMPRFDFSLSLSFAHHHSKGSRANFGKNMKMLLIETDSLSFLDFIYVS